MKSLLGRNKKSKERVENQPQQQDQNEAISKPRSPGVFITSDLNKLLELPPADRALGNRRPLNKTSDPSTDLYQVKIKSILNQNPTLRRNSNSNMLNPSHEPKYTVTRTQSNMSLNLQPVPANIENAISSSTDSRPSSNLSLANRPSSNLQATTSQMSTSRRMPEMIEIASEREATVRNYEIEQFRNDENDLKEQFNDLILKMDALQKTLADLEGREMEEVQLKRQEAENFEKETREQIEQMQVRKEEIDRDASRLGSRLKELKSLQRETRTNKNLNDKMQNEMAKCLRKLGKQYENGCRKYLRELQEMENEANERRNRDRELMDQYKHKQSELAVLLEEKMILRKSLEERNQLEKLLGQNGISLLVASNQTGESFRQQQESPQQHQELVN